MNEKNSLLPPHSILIGIHESGFVNLYLATSRDLTILLYTLKGFCRGEAPFKEGADAEQFLKDAVREKRTVKDFEAHVNTLPEVDRDFINGLRGRPYVPKAPEGKVNLLITSEIYESGGLYGFILKLDGKETTRSPAAFATDEEARKAGSAVMSLTAEKLKHVGEVHRVLGE